MYRNNQENPDEENPDVKHDSQHEEIVAKTEKLTYPETVNLDTNSSESNGENKSTKRSILKKASELSVPKSPNNPQVMRVSFDNATPSEKMIPYPQIKSNEEDYIIATSNSFSSSAYSKSQETDSSDDSNLKKLFVHDLLNWLRLSTNYPSYDTRNSINSSFSSTSSSTSTSTYKSNSSNSGSSSSNSGSSITLRIKQHLKLHLDHTPPVITFCGASCNEETAKNLKATEEQSLASPTVVVCDTCNCDGEVKTGFNKAGDTTSQRAPSLFSRICPLTSVHDNLSDDSDSAADFVIHNFNVDETISVNLTPNKHQKTHSPLMTSKLYSRSPSIQLLPDKERISKHSAASQARSSLDGVALSKSIEETTLPSAATQLSGLLEETTSSKLIVGSSESKLA